MREHVPAPCTTLCKSHATYLTQKGFFPCVDSLVRCQTAFLRETLVACLTDPWLLARMGAHVEFQTFFNHEKLSTFVTAIFFLHILALRLLSLPRARHPFLCFDVGSQTESKLLEGISCSNYGFEAPIMCSKLLHVLGLQMWGNLQFYWLTPSHHHTSYACHLRQLLDSCTQPPPLLTPLLTFCTCGPLQKS